MILVHTQIFLVHGYAFLIHGDMFLVLHLKPHVNCGTLIGTTLNLCKRSVILYILDRPETHRLIYNCGCSVTTCTVTRGESHWPRKLN